ncbi:hypothetical protein HY496_01795 [Candidatus Woesearchaeota archaeon]|nr:hypothetical protein [Candidatus Woesearchaeota archaeon]
MESKTIQDVPLPSEDESLRYFEDYKVPKNIRAHCLRVRQVSRFLAEKLVESGIVEIDVTFTDRLGLFHDLFKAAALKELKPNKFHSYEFSEEEIAMWKKLREKYPGMYEGEIAHLVFKDTYLELASSLKKVSDPRATDLNWMENIVHYADWRVFQDAIVSLDERIRYLQERYPRNDNAWDLFIAKMRGIEEHLFQHLSFSPTELAQKMSEEEL